MSVGERLHAALVPRGQTVSCAESVTGGALAQELSAASGASAWFVGGVVSYATAVKRDLLGVPAGVVDTQGVVSAACAEAMADGVRRLLGTDWAVSTTGVAGPDSQEGKPVGLVHVGLAGPSGTSSHEMHLGGTRAEIRAAAVSAAVRSVLAAVRDQGAPTEDLPVDGVSGA